MAAKAKVNRSDVIRKILKDIGAVRKNAPEGWAKMVSTKLDKMGIKVSTPMIYQLRSKEMAKTGVTVKAKRRRKSVAAKANAVEQVMVAAVAPPQMGGKYDALFAVKKLASELGGLEHLESAVQVLKQLSQ